MKESNIPYGGFAFTGNPIFLVDSDNALGSHGSGSFAVYVGGNMIYEGKCTAPVHINIADIVDSHIGQLPDVPDVRDEPVYRICPLDESNLVEARVSSAADDSWDVCCHAISGGISKQNYRRLQSLGRNIFEARFLNRACNYFMTTRTDSWQIVMKETDLYPLYFIADDDSLALEVKECHTGVKADFSSNYAGVLALDIEWIRKYFFDTHGVLSSQFDVISNGVVSCRIIIERCNPAKDLCRLKFRNSLGAFEVLDITGLLSESRSTGDSEEDVYDHYDDVTDDFYSQRDRRSVSLTLSADVTLRHSGELLFFYDMLASGEVWLLDLTPLPIKVIPSVEEQIYPHRIESPQTMKLTLTVADKESALMSDIVNGDEWIRRRIFTPHFNKQFN